MSTFWTFAIILTIGYILYYAAMITIDITAKPKTAASEEELIETGAEGDAATDVVEDSGGGFVVMHGGKKTESFSEQGGQSQQPYDDYAANILRDRSQFEDETEGDPLVREPSAPEYSAYMPPVPQVPEEGQPEEPREGSDDPSVRSDEAPPEGQSAAIGTGVSEAQGTDAPSDAVDGRQPQDGTPGEGEKESFDISRFAFTPKEESPDQQQDDTLDESVVFSQHRTPQFVVNEIHYPETSPEVRKETEDNNAALEPITTRSTTFDTVSLSNLLYTNPSALERRGIEYEVY